MSDIFISHATANDEIVTRIHDDLERATGRAMWVDHKDIKPGDNWQDSIEIALKKCPDMLLVISRKSMSSVEVTAEWRAALAYKHRLLLVIIDDISWEDIPARLRLLQWVDLTKGYEAGLQKLIAAIKGETLAGGDVPEFKYAPVRTGTIDRLLLQTPLRGRDDDLSAIKTALENTPTLIVGVGGLGKSKLAAEVVRTSDTWQGVIWQKLNEYTQAYDVIELLKEHFELSVTTERRDVLKQLKTQKTLVVLDNAEDVPPTDTRHPEFVALVNDLLQHGAKVLLTSRVEWKALKPVTHVEPTQLDPADARQLVLDIAGREGVPDLAKEADAIARDALYHPRLIEWAVELLVDLPLSEILSDLKTLKSQDAQDAMQKMVGKTLDRLITSGTAGEQAAAALKRLIVCRGGFTLDAAKALIPPILEPEDVRTALTTLTTWRFIRFDQPKQRYDLPQIVIAALTPDSAAHQPHFDYYKALARQYEDSADPEKYLKLDIESDNLEAAFEWVMEVRDYEQAFWLNSACTFFLTNRGRFEQRKNWLERVAIAVSDDALVDEGIERLKAAVQNSLGYLYGDYPFGDRRVNLKQSLAAFEDALVYATPETAPLEYAITQNNLGNTYANLSRIASTPEDRANNLRYAVAAYKVALVYHTPQSTPRQYAMTQNNLGNAYSDLATIEDQVENLKLAVRAFEAALVYRSSQSVPLDYARTQNNLGSVYRSLARIAIHPEERLENLKRAVLLYESSLVYRTSQSTPLGYARTQANLGLVQEDLGDFQLAIACWREAERYFRQMGHVQDADKMLKWIAESESR